MRLINETTLDFDDIIILPKRSLAASRKDVDLNRTLVGLHSKKTLSGIPLIAANMNSTGSFAMAKALSAMDCWTAINKFYSIDRWKELQNNIDEYGHRIFYTLGMRKKDIDKYNSLSSIIDIPFVNLDVANGYTETFVNFVREFRQKYTQTFIMAGNVCTAEMTQELILAGADCVKIGIGSGANCTTRIVAGVGYPQFSAIIECADVAHGLGGLICSDGGCRRICDPGKAFGAGADLVMLGNGLLGGTDECEGTFLYKKNRWYFRSYGMSSAVAMYEHYGQKEDYKASEGKEVLIPYKGPVRDTIQEILGGLRSCCAYVGAKRLKDLSKCATFIRVNRTHNTLFGDYHGMVDNLGE